MADKYDHTKIENKWQASWLKDKIYQASENPSVKNKKKYVLDMFPYPSGSSMHVGHLEGYVGTDILSRYFRMKGFSVLHPMGWDAFGLPAENYAIKTGIHPDKSTHANINVFKRQLDISGMSYDWSKEIDTSSPEFYKWTQWLFIQLFNKGLAYKKKSPVNWCPKDETVLANEQVIDGLCERCDTPVIQKELDQWFFKITDYADRLISGLDNIDWLDEVKRQQINWIGKSEGMEINIDGIKIFTTRPDTLEGATFMALAANHPWLDKKYEFTTDLKNKEGEFTGKYVKNPLNGRKMPVWAVNYVDMNYGTGAIMGVPYLDERDREFAEKYHLDIVEVEPNQKLWKTLEEKGLGEKKTNYHIRDWLISRQRYWGCPIPMVYCEDDGWQPVPESDLPILLPLDVDFLPHGESPIATSKTFQKGATCPKCGKAARREVDTMDTYVDSSWYFMRFCDPKNAKEFAAKEKIVPVDDYVGGGHVVQHLLFARFFWKALYDQGLIDKSVGDEPFLKLRAPGWILGSDSRKMSKRWGNVVTPDDIIPKFGADTLRVYEMFMGPFDVMKPWSTTGVEGANRFLGRVYRLFQLSGISSQQKTENPNVISKLHQTIKKVGEDIENYKFNTAISSLMELVNTMTQDASEISISDLKILALLLAPFAPHMMEEVWHAYLHMDSSIHTASWPSYEAKYTVKKESTIIIQINGKVRSQLVIDSDKATDQKLVEAKAMKDDRTVKYLDGVKIKNIIFVSGKLLNFVTE
ncbi:MAG TPA: class I tRNA ligase family protein [Patescibacteria group bacterium]|nr:class I tRNA ligase family protein [Patescibacteria group bacterium]